MLKDDKNGARGFSLVDCGGGKGGEDDKEEGEKKSIEKRMDRGLASQHQSQKVSQQEAMTGQEFELREQDRWLPIANVARLMKNTLPTTAKVSKDAKECMQECVSEFISFVTSEASDRCLMEKRKTINGEDVLYSLHTLGFENYAEVLKIYLAKYRQQQALKQERGEIRQKKKKKKKPEEEEGEEEGSSYVKQEGDGVFEYPMDESMVVVRGDMDKSSTGAKPGPKAPGYDPYVSQLYEQSYAGVSMNMANPDYRGGASESIMSKKEHGVQKLGDGGDEQETGHERANSNGVAEDDHGHGRMPLPLDTDSMDLRLDGDVGVGVNIHLGNTESLDEINSRLNRGGPGEETVEESSATARGVSAAATSTSPPASAESAAASTTAGAAVTTTAGSVDDASDPEHDHDHDRRLQQRRRAEELGKTPATTSTSDLLLLNDNMAAITETEEIAGLTNGHGVLYNFE